MGDYVFKTDGSLSASHTWQLSMVLLQAEEAFACLKGTMGLRPNFHQLTYRVEVHTLMPSPAGSATFRAVCGSLFQGLSQGLSQGFPAFQLISVLAYQLGNWIGRTLRACGENRDWETLRCILPTHSLSPPSCLGETDALCASFMPRGLTGTAAH